MSCLLGITDVRIPDENVISWQTNKIGGRVIFPTEIGSVPEPSCVLCGRQQLLVVQLYCPLQYSKYHRLMFVFACTNPECWNKSDSWIVYRCQVIDCAAKKATDNQTSDEFKVAGDSDWGVDDADSWGADGTDDWGGGAEPDHWGMKGASEGVFASEREENTEGIEPKRDTNIGNCDISDVNGCMDIEHAQKPDCEGHSIEHPQQDTMNELKLQQMNLHDSDSDIDGNLQVIPEGVINVPADKTRLKMLCEVSLSSVPSCTIIPYYLNVFEEPANQEDNYHVTKLLKEYEKKEGYRLDDTEYMEDSSGSGGQAEGYERTHVTHKDMKFHRFMKRLSLCPEQCIRYEWSGTPLFIRDLSSSDIPRRCSHCGGETVFEFQLMPALVNYLKAEATDTVVEFGTVLIYSCKQSCWEENVAVKTEHVIVQPDPDQDFFK